MAETVVLASVTLIFILILIQKISLRFLFNDKLYTEIDYSFLTLVLSGGVSKKGFRKFNPRLLPKLKAVVEFLLIRSEITVSEIKINFHNKEPNLFILRSKNLFSLFAALTVYLSRKAKKLSLNDSSLKIYTDGSEKTSHSFDLSIKAPLYVALITAFKLLLINLKNKKPIKAKRGQNG